MEPDLCLAILTGFRRKGCIQGNCCSRIDRIPALVLRSCSRSRQPAETFEKHRPFWIGGLSWMYWLNPDDDSRFAGAIGLIKLQSSLMFLSWCSGLVDYRAEECSVENSSGLSAIR